MGFVEDYIHGLSQVDFHHGPNKDLSAWSRANKNDREHVAILDGLALLLVFASQGDITAVTYWHLADEFNLLWAKNQPVDNSSQLQYIEELLQKARDGAMPAQMLEMVIPMCKEKIFRRIKKLANSFGREGDFNLWGFDKTKRPCHSLEAALRRAYDRKLSTIERLDNFTRSIRLITKTSSTDEFYQILYFAWTVTVTSFQVHGLKKLLEASQVRYLEKLGDYIRILTQIPSILKKIGTAKIVATQVREFTVCS
jgi:hypothetical protein